MPVDVFVGGRGGEGEVVGGGAYDGALLGMDGTHGFVLVPGEPVVDVPELWGVGC